MASVVPPDADLPTPTERLEASRARLRAALLEIVHPPERPPAFSGLGGLKKKLLDRLKALPGSELVIDTLEGWWAQHPLHAASIVAEEASRKFIVPAARRNPYGLILGSVVVGALFMISKPWKWLLRPALFVGLVPQIAAQAMQRLPVDAWLDLLNSVMPAKPAAKGDDRASHLPPSA